MQLTKEIKLLPSKKQEADILATTREFISLVNDMLDYAVALGRMPKMSSASVRADLPSALKNQCCLDARSIWKKTLKDNGPIPVLKKPVAIWNNQNYTIDQGYISFPLWVAGKSQKVKVKAIIPGDVFTILSNSKLGTLRISRKNKKYIAQIAYEVSEGTSPGSQVMGIDLGIKCPAVVVTSDGATKFYGNGRKNKYVRRHYAKRRQKLGKAKKLDAIRKSNNKEQRWMRDQDHKISRSIVNDAVAHNVGTIKLETLSGIRASTRKSRKNNHSLHSWSFYRLAHYIEYKAKIAGIDVVYVNPAYTSQTCPHCGHRHHANDRTYICPSCGYRGHRDRIGAVNILAA